MGNLRRFWPYIWPHYRGISVVLFTLLAGVGLTVLQPWPMKLLVDSVLSGKPPQGTAGEILAILPGSEDPRTAAAWVAVATVILFLAGTTLTLISTTAFVSIGQRMVYDLAADVFLKLQKHSLLFHNTHQVGDLVSRITVDTYCVQALVAHTVFPLLQSGLTLCAVFGVMWALDPGMALLSLLVVPLLCALIGGFASTMERAARVRSDLDAELMSRVEQTLSGIPAIQAFAREKIEAMKFRERANAAVEAHRKSTLVDLWFKLLVGLVTSVATAGLLYLGAGRVMDGAMTVGTILVFLAYLHSLYDPINTIVYAASTVRSIGANAARVREILDVPTAIVDKPEAKAVVLRGAIRYENVTFGYDAGRPVLNGVTLMANPGETIAIVGPTGAGKTTLLHMLPRFFDPWEGTITIDGHDLRDLPVESLRRQVALVLQEPYLFPISVAENIAFGRPNALREEVVAAALAANADAFIRKLPHGYDTVIGERGATLSGGERQRLSIARAFLKDAPILILDEPTSALDAITEGQLLDALARLCEGRTTFVIAHRLSTIRAANRILVLENGQVVEEGRHEDLRERGGLYSRLHRQQIGEPERKAIAHG